MVSSSRGLSRGGAGMAANGDWLDHLARAAALGVSRKGFLKIVSGAVVAALLRRSGTAAEAATCGPCPKGATCNDQGQCECRIGGDVCGAACCNTNSGAT